MGFKTADFPPVDVETFLDRPLRERVKALALHWVEYGFGSPKMIHFHVRPEAAVPVRAGGDRIGDLDFGRWAGVGHRGLVG